MEPMKKIKTSKKEITLVTGNIKGPVLTEDTSLGFNAHKGLPGPYIKWYEKKLGLEGLAKMLDSYEDKTGYAQCIIAYMKEGYKEPKIFVGTTNGNIIHPNLLEGEKPFGWDPIFEPEGMTREAFSKLEQSEKFKISPRGRAVAKLKQFFEENNEI